MSIAQNRTKASLILLVMVSLVITLSTAQISRAATCEQLRQGLLGLLSPQDMRETPQPFLEYLKRRGFDSESAMDLIKYRSELLRKMVRNEIKPTNREVVDRNGRSYVLDEASQMQGVKAFSLERAVAIDDPEELAFTFLAGKGSLYNNHGFIDSTDVTYFIGDAHHYKRDGGFLLLFLIPPEFLYRGENARGYDKHVREYIVDNHQIFRRKAGKRELKAILRQNGYPEAELDDIIQREGLRDVFDYLPFLGAIDDLSTGETYSPEEFRQKFHREFRFPKGR